MPEDHRIAYEKQHCQQMTKKKLVEKLPFPRNVSQESIWATRWLENWKLLPMPLAQSHRGCLRECVILRPEPSMRLAASRSHGSRPRCRGVKVTRSLTFFSKHRSKKVIFTWHAWNTNRLKSYLPNTMKITPFTENVCRIDYSKFQCCIFITFWEILI